jgi:diadenosine tetraphosphate (Ap4A) HIT family hydrolase
MRSAPAARAWSSSGVSGIGGPDANVAAVEWPESFYAMKGGEGCPLCEDGGPDNGHGIRFFAGESLDAYLQRTGVQRGYTVAVWRGRHVAEPTELTEEEAAGWWRELVDVGRALERHFRPVKLNYELLGNALPHLHAHVMPRYADDPRPGWPFPWPDEDPPQFPEDEVRRDADALRALL